MTFTLVHMTPTRLVLAVASTAVLAYAGGCTIGQGHDVRPGHDAVPFHAQCTEIASWPEAQAAWDGLVAQGWTNPRNGDVTILVQPGCADAWN